MSKEDRVFGIKESDEVCANCAHYVQHYAIKTYPPNIGSYMTVNDGHCIHSRLKNRKPDNTCKHFVTPVVNEAIEIMQRTVAS